MKWKWLIVLGTIGAGMGCAAGLAQAPVEPNRVAPAESGPNAGSGPVILAWTPPAFAQLSAEASTRSSFSLDRNMLAAAASLMSESDAETRQAIAKIEGVSVHMLRFGPAGNADVASVEAIRQAYHLRGWKHLVTNVTGADAKGPIRNGTTDLWLVLDGANVRGAVALVETPKSLTLVTMAGNLSPADILHLRGHFGIPRFDGENFIDPKGR